MTDPAGVVASSVVAVVANGDIRFQVGLVQAADGTFHASFDTAKLPSYAVYPSISFLAEDVLGNQSSTGYWSLSTIRLRLPTSIRRTYACSSRMALAAGPSIRLDRTR